MSQICEILFSLFFFLFCFGRISLVQRLVIGVEFKFDIFFWYFSYIHYLSFTKLVKNMSWLQVLSINVIWFVPIILNYFLGIEFTPVFVVERNI